MSLQKLLPLVLTLSVALTGLAEDAPRELSDTLNEISVTAIKGTKLRFEPLAATNISMAQIKRFNINGLKGVSEVASNFFMPQYGSRMTSSIYVRGLGARMDQPSVGLNVDNVPFLNKDAYDMDIPDIERIEVLKGPQSTLYGRNSMAGLVNITTLSPLRYQGIRMMAQAGTANNFGGFLSGYKRVNPNVGMMLGMQIRHLGGWYRNQYNHKRPDRENGGSVRNRVAARLSEHWMLDNAATVAWSKQDGYPYAWEKTDEIRYNDTCYYKRLTVNDGLTVKYMSHSLTVASITSFQYIDDDMTLDQDFRPEDYFTITQRRWERGGTQDLMAKGVLGNYQWLAGVFGFYKHSTMNAPVNFKDTGIAQLIEQHRNDANPLYPIEWDERNLLLSSRFGTTTGGLAVYHRSSYQLGEWNFSMGLRLDWEKASMDYHSRCQSGFKIIDVSTGQLFRHQSVDIDDTGRLSHSFTEFLPAVTVTRSFGQSLIYVSASKGYKPGGFNNQMFSDVLQQRVMHILGLAAPYEVDKIVSYKPEVSYNYEAGLHVECKDGQVKASLAAFYIDCRDQQLTMFPDGSITGRIMTNAGKTHSYGTELTFDYQPRPLRMGLSWGWTHATFARYNDGKADYKGNQVPYAPAHTLFASCGYDWKIGGFVVSADVNARGAGAIYWDDANEFRQPFYMLLGARASLSRGCWNVALWGENLTQTNYKTFRYVSMGNGFYQRGLPVRGGITLTVELQ